MTPPRSTLDWEGQTILDRAGEKVGKIEEIFLVEETGRPEWALVKLGRIKSQATLVPLTRANPVSKGIKVPYAREDISGAPQIDSGGEPSQQQVDALYRHYRIAQPSGNGATSARQAPTQVQHGATSAGAPPQPQQQPEQAQGRPDLRDEPIGELFQTVKEQGATLVGQEVKLAKAEIGGKAKEIGVGAGMFGGAGYVGYLASLALMLAIIFGLAEVMPAWLAALIVAVVLGAVAAVVAMKAKKKIQQAGPPIPEQTVESVKQTIETVKEEAKWGLGQTR